MKSTLRHELSKALLLGAILALSSQVAAEEPVGEKGALSAAGQNQAPSPPKGLFIASGQGTGLTAQYFDNLDFTNLKVTRTDATLNFDWASGTPDPLIGSETFSTRWTGQVEAPASGTYTFYTVSDDGIRLWVNGTLLIDNWTLHPPTENSGTISLAAGQKYAIKIDYYENWGGAVAKLLWSGPRTTKETVPQQRLYPGAPPGGQGGASGTGLTAQYFDNADLTNLKVTRTDATVNFDWASGTPDPLIGSDTFSTRWTGQVEAPASGTYTFYTASDDGIRLWVNGTLLIDNWTDHAPTENSGTISLAAGQKYAIKIEYYENLGGAVAKLLWSGPGTTKETVPQQRLYPGAPGGTGGIGGPVDEEFVGPFPSWKNVKDFGAKGDGITDDSNAIQAALTALKPVQTNAYSVLYFPAGNYRITKTLVTTRAQHFDYLGAQIIGEDPANTTFVWDGPLGQKMLSLDLWLAKVSRFTFDGKGKASVGLYRGDSFSTGCELSDLRFRDMGTGIQLGSDTGGGQSEPALLRNRFERMTKYGILAQNFNTLDVWIWYNYFEDCNAGVHNGAGNFHIYRSVFLRSKMGDITHSNLQSFAFVGNTSVGSKNFFNWASQHTWSAQVLVQGNRIYDTQDDYAMVTGNAGPWLLVDNVIRNRVGYGGPSVSATSNDQVLVGNTYTGTSTINVNTGRGNVRVRNIGANLVARDAVPAPDLTLPPTPPNRHRKIFEVNPNTSDDAAALQAQIDAAALEPAGTRPVVHIPKGALTLARTVVVPANKDLQIIGDGYSENGTRINNTGGATTTLRLDGPSRAVLRDFLVGGGTGDGILITNADQPGGRVFTDQFVAYSNPATPPAYGIHVNGVETSDVSLMSTIVNGNQRNIVARGGPLRSTGQTAPGQVSAFGGPPRDAGSCSTSMTEASYWPRPFGTSKGQTRYTSTSIRLGRLRSPTCGLPFPRIPSFRPPAFTDTGATSTS
jgi:PA14 domain/Pectate lyase superfamily protein